MGKEETPKACSRPMAVAAEAAGPGNPGVVHGGGPQMLAHAGRKGPGVKIEHSSTAGGPPTRPDGGGGRDGAVPGINKEIRQLDHDRRRPRGRTCAAWASPARMPRADHRRNEGHPHQEDPGPARSKQAGSTGASWAEPTHIDPKLIEGGGLISAKHDTLHPGGSLRSAVRPRRQDLQPSKTPDTVAARWAGGALEGQSDCWLLNRMWPAFLGAMANSSASSSVGARPARPSPTGVASGGIPPKLETDIGRRWRRRRRPPW